MCVVKQELKEGKEKNEVNVTRKPEKKICLAPLSIVRLYIESQIMQV